MTENLDRWNEAISGLNADDLVLAEQCLLGSLAARVDPETWARAQRDAFTPFWWCVGTTEDTAVPCLAAPDQPVLFEGWGS